MSVALVVAGEAQPALVVMEAMGAAMEAMGAAMEATAAAKVLDVELAKARVTATNLLSLKELWASTR